MQVVLVEWVDQAEQVVLVEQVDPVNERHQAAPTEKVGLMAGEGQVVPDN